jgi:hypothetical protein
MGAHEPGGIYGHYPPSFAQFPGTNSTTSPAGKHALFHLALRAIKTFGLECAQILGLSVTADGSVPLVHQVYPGHQYAHN